MDTIAVFKENSDIANVNKSYQFEISKEALNKFERLFEVGSLEDMLPDEIKKLHENNSEYRIGGHIYETDDNGATYKKDGKLLSNVKYTINNNKYETNKYGNLKYSEATPKHITEENSRNIKEQMAVGGEERQEDDEGGHIIARILGGSDGIENLVPMRRTINRGDYKRMENEIAKAVQEGKEVIMKINLNYVEDSRRPSKIQAEYTVDGKKNICVFDNEKDSTELMDSLDGKISKEDYACFKEEIEDMQNDGCAVSITSVKMEFAENGDTKKIVVGYLDESTGTKSYKVFEAC